MTRSSGFGLRVPTRGLTYPGTPRRRRRSRFAVAKLHTHFRFLG